MSHVNELDAIDLGRGMYMKTYSDLPRDQASSAFQKDGVRRCSEGGLRALQWGLEMYLAGGVQRTNIINRLIVTTVEDIGLADPEALVSVVQCLFPETFADEKDRKLIESMPGCSRIVAFGTACVYAAQRPKSRINDWVAHIFHDLHDNDGDTDLKNPIFRTSPEEIADMFRESLFNLDTRSCLYYAEILYRHPDKLEKAISRSKKPESAIWKCFQEFVDEKVEERFRSHAQAYLDVMVFVSKIPSWKADKVHGKCRLLHIHFIHLACVRPGGFNFQFTTLRLCPDMLPFVQDIVDKVIPVPDVPDFAKDLHTAAGRRLKRGIKDFVDEGALLVNESKEYKEQSDAYLKEAFEDNNEEEKD